MLNWLFRLFLVRKKEPHWKTVQRLSTLFPENEGIFVVVLRNDRVEGSGSVETWVKYTVQAGEFIKISPESEMAKAYKKGIAKKRNP